MDRILIIGAGIAGLTLALELHAIGRNCTIFEAAPSIEPFGVGLNLQPYAVANLHRIGLATALQKASLQPSRCIYSSCKARGETERLLMKYLPTNHEPNRASFAGGVAVRTMTSDMLRDTAIEEITVILLRFASCVRGTVMVLDTRAATWARTNEAERNHPELVETKQ